MLLYLAARIVSSATAFLYPGYASYKTLSQRPASEEELERWLMYWSVLGCIVGVEYLFEWVVSWLPFYYSIKSLFLLYLVLPQTQGASYLYTTHLQPFFNAHERQIDNMLAQIKARIYRFVQDRIRALWDGAAASLQGQQPGTASAQEQQQPNKESRGLAPAQIFGSLWRAYGPSIIASGAMLLKSAPPSSTSTLRTPPYSTYSNSNSHDEQNLLDRRRKLAAELAALDTLIPSNSSTAASTSGLAFGLRERTNSGSGRFEEMVPSDLEGYEVGDNRDYDEGQGDARPAVQGKASWFGWGSGSSKGEYERIKSD